jgi:gliding motility-associated-like protein
VKVNVSNPEILPDKLPVYVHNVPYSVQLKSNAQNPVFNYEGALVTGISMTPDGLISGIVPESAGREESTFTVSATGSDGCEAVGKEYVLRTCDPAPDVPADMIVYCLGEQPAQLQASSPNGHRIQWYDAGLNRLDAAPVPNTSSASKQVFYAAQVNETLQCESPMATITVIVNPVPSANFGVSTDVACAGSSPVIRLDDIRENCIYSIYSDKMFNDELGSLTGVSSGTVNLVGRLEHDTTYYIRVTDSLGCISSEWKELPVKVINLYIEPEKLPPYLKNTDYEQTLITNAQSPIFTVIEGMLPAGLSLDPSGTISGTTHLSDNRVANIFTVKLQDPNGCSVTRIYTLKGEVFVPKIFTPNNDGVNDVFMQGCKVIIFDRLGIELFRGDNGWDGTYKGRTVVQSIYFYLLEHVDDDGNRRKFKGYIGVHY